MDDIDKLLCDTDGDAIVDALRDLCGDLTERYGLDSIHIIATKSERMTTRKIEGATRVFQVGAGNYHARYGSIKEWITKEEAHHARCFADDSRNEEA